MPSLAELRDEARGLRAKISEIMNDAESTAAEKSAKLDDIEADVKSVDAQISNSERASDMRAKLEGVGTVYDEKGKQLPKFEMPSPYTAASRKGMAYEALEQGDVEKVFAAKDGFRQKYDFAFELGTKDATATNNLIGEGLYGQTGPTAVGQNPFLPGAFGPGILPDFRPGIVEKLFYELTLADLISSFSTTAPNISYLTESLVNLQANQVAESALYPYSSIEVARTYAQVGKIANAMTISDEAIADAPTLFNFVQGRVLMSLQRQEEVQVLAATGYPGVSGLLSFAANFTATSSGSLFNASSGSTLSNVAFPPAGTNGAGVQSQTISTLNYGRNVPGPSGAPSGTYATAVAVAENIQDAFVDIELQVFQKPNAIVMHPRDWEALRLAKDASGQYFSSSFFGADYGQRANNGGKVLWDTPVVTTPLMPQHLILTGWFDPQTVQIARRQGVSMQMTNANGTDFVQGNVTVRAEERLGLLCYRPSAFQLININHV